MDKGLHDASWHKPPTDKDNSTLEWRAAEKCPHTGGVPVAHRFEFEVAVFDPVTEVGLDVSDGALSQY
jgi:hypothetical protein